MERRELHSQPFARFYVPHHGVRPDFAFAYQKVQPRQLSDGAGLLGFDK